MTTKEYLQQIDDVITNGKYKDSWESLSNHKTPDWYYKGKLGIFIHWGIYSVPAYGNEWYSRSMYDKKCKEYLYHRKNYGPQNKFGYKDFIPMPKIRIILKKAKTAIGISILTVFMQIK